MARFLILLAFLLLPSGVFAQAEDEDYQRWLEGRAKQRAFEHLQFEEAGFDSIAEAQVEGRDVRRGVFRDPYGFMHLAGLEFEKHGSGAVTVTAQYSGWTLPTQPLEADWWDRLSALEWAVFAESEYVRVERPAKPIPPPPPPPICHGWIVRFAAAWEKTESWSECGGGKDAERQYATTMIEAAISARADCVYDPEKPFSSFANCYGASLELDDQELSERFAAIRRAYEDASVAKELAAARKLLREPGLKQGSPQWNTALEAVRKVREKDAARQEQVDRARRLKFDFGPISDADRARIDLVIRNWTRQETAFARNTSWLMRDLLWPRE